MKERNRTLKWIIGLILILVTSMIVTLSIGSVKVPFNAIVSIFANYIRPQHPDSFSSMETVIILQLRLPRVLLAIIIGAMLSAAGVGFQGILRNPLADPYILGISTGAALGAASSIMLSRLHLLWMSSQWTLPLFAFAGSLVSLWLVMNLANRNGSRDRESLILAGVIIQSLLGAFLSFLIAISGQQMQQIVYWMMGSLANKSWIHVVILLPYLIIGLGFVFLKYKELDIISLGESAANHLGLNVERTKVLMLGVGSLLTAAAVSVVGVIGFVGLIVPHMMRILVGPNHKLLLFSSTLAGGIFLLWSDTLARSIVPSTEVPIGVITAFIGAPFFGYLFKKHLRR